MPLKVSRLFSIAVVANILLIVPIEGDEEIIATASSYAYASAGNNYEERPRKRKEPTETTSPAPTESTNPAPTETTNPAPNDTTTSPPSTSPAPSNTSAEEQFKEGNLKFTTDFFYNVIQANPNASVIMSPFSLLFLLAQLALYASGEALQQLLAVLALSKPEQIREAIPPILDSIAEQKNVTLSLAERVYGNINNEFTDAFKKDTKDIFRAEAENLNFSNPQQAADTINAWVAANTNNKIINLVPKSAVTPQTQAVLVNAIYFLGEWVNKFNKGNTQPGTFYVTKDKNVTIDLMHQVKYFKYAEIAEIDAKAVELPYVNGNLTFLVVLPNDQYADTNSLAKTLTPQQFDSVRNSLQSTRVDLTLPKFNSTLTINLVDILKQLNVTEIFDPNSGGLKGIVKWQQKLYVSAAIQKAIIIVDEKGSEAAAANVITVGAAAAIQQPQPKVFKADHRFLYYLLFQGNPIFCGLFSGIS